MEFVLAALVAVLVTPVAATVARRTGVVDRPGELKTHTRPVPYLGGVAVFAALAVGVVAVGRYEYFAPLGLALVLGVTDDVRPLPPRLRLAVELVIAVVAGLVAPGPGLVRLAVAVSVVVLMNAVNLLDGQDGLAGAVGLIAAMGLAWLGGDARPYSLALAGALAGFLVFNRPPARIYLGDGGAYLLGTALALALPLTDPGGSAWALWFAAPLLVGVPLAGHRRRRSGGGWRTTGRSSPATGATCTTSSSTAGSGSARRPRPARACRWCSARSGWWRPVWDHRRHWP